jgi:oligosaccharide 4-alpha-D-glucosyltransferase
MDRGLMVQEAQRAGQNPRYATREAQQAADRTGMARIGWGERVPGGADRLLTALRALGAALALIPALAPAAHYRSHTVQPEALVITSDEGQLTLRFHTPQALEVHFEPEGDRQLPSFSIAQPAVPQGAQLQESADALVYGTPVQRAVIRKSPLRIRHERARPDGTWETFLAEERGGYAYAGKRGFRFALTPGEQLIGGGQRVLGMDRRGQRLPLYNKPSYGYTTRAKQMYYSLPAVLSDRQYLLLFDNSAKGWMDLGKTEAEVLHFEAIGGRLGYLLVSGDSYPQILEHYTRVTGRQPLPPRWALGHYASRFGYRSEAEVREVVRKHRELGFPLDAVVIDIYWFGPDIQGHMGHLRWDRTRFPNPEAMMADLKAQGVHTVLVTEPFVLTTSSRWDEAVAADVLAKDLAGKPKTFDFYFGHTGLIDVFKPEAQQWFWGIYRELFEQGMSGVWGDLGEPEVHPEDTVHVNGIANEVHNAFGHTWAQMVYENHLRAWPERRPFILMRAGAAGSQRYGMIPWTGDVARSWGGLKPQVELSLQMGLLGLAYNHSDLGGFAGGERFDPELYERWLQYGVFQPIFRPHAQDHIPSEPVFHGRRTRERAKAAIELRYRLMPYLYTLAWENATRGLPLMRPLSFIDERDPRLFVRDDAYLWGDALLVAPVTERRQRRKTLELPSGVYFDFHTGERIEGGRAVELKLHPEHIPVLARAGHFVPLVAVHRHAGEYSSAELELRYYADPSAPTGAGWMYEDDGELRTAIEDGRFEMLSFRARQQDSRLTIALARGGGDYAGKPETRSVTLVVENPPARETFLADGQPLPRVADAKALVAVERGAVVEGHRVRLKFPWRGPAAAVELR